MQIPRIKRTALAQAVSVVVMSAALASAAQTANNAASTNTTSGNKPLTSISNLMVTANKDFELGFSHNSTETSGVAAFTFAGEKAGLRLVLDASNKSQHAMAAVGIPFGKGYFVGGYSVGKEPIVYPGIDADMKGESIFAKLEYNQPISSIRKITLDVLSQRTQSKTLGTMDTPFTDVSSRDIGNNTIRTTTFTGVDRMTWEFCGGKLDRVSLGAEADVADNGIFSLTAHHTNRRIAGEASGDKTNSLSAGYKHYLADARANLSIQADTEGQLRLGAEKNFANNPFSLHVSAFKNTKGNKDSGVYAAVRYAFGAESNKIDSMGIRPVALNTQKTQAQVLNGIYNPRDYFGKVLKKTQRIQISESTSDLICLPAVAAEASSCTPGATDNPTTVNVLHAPVVTVEADYSVDPPILLTQGQLIGTITVSCTGTDSDGITGTCQFNSTDQSGAAYTQSFALNTSRTFNLYHDEGQPCSPTYADYTVTGTFVPKDGLTCGNKPPIVITAAPGRACASDIRLKQNIQPMGVLPNGLNLYSWQYIWGGERQVGVMAQEVLSYMPSAVVTRPDGFYAVRYDLLGLQMMSEVEFQQRLAIGQNPFGLELQQPEAVY